MDEKRGLPAELLFARAREEAAARQELEPALDGVLSDRQACVLPTGCALPDRAPTQLAKMAQFQAVLTQAWMELQRVG